MSAGIARAAAGRATHFAALVLAVALLVPDGAAAIDAVLASPDVAVDLSGTTVHDAEVVLDDGLAPPSPLAIGLVPPGAAVDAFHLRFDGDRLLSFDVTVDLGGGVIAEPGDVVCWDGAAHQLVFDASVHGLPASANLDALAEWPDGTLIVSFDGAVAPGGVFADDEDLLRFDGSAWSLVLDLSTTGIDPALDLDALHFGTGETSIFVSFDGSGVVQGTPFDDEDVIAYSLLAGQWSLAYDAAAAHADWAHGDLEAVHLVPEALATHGLALGSLLVGWLARRRVGVGRRPDQSLESPMKR